MDFWAQHKDFILKVLAGVGVFLVALIARGITYGDELENEQARTGKLKNEISSKKIPKPAEIRELNAIAAQLQQNADSLAGQVGWNLGKAPRGGTRARAMRTSCGRPRTRARPSART